MSQGTGQWQGSYNDFTVEGAYNVAVFVEDKEGFLSLPVQTVVNAISVPTTTSATTTSTTTSTSTTTTTTLPVPSVMTGSAGSVGTDSATLTGTVNPNGITSQYHFEYGRSGVYGTTTAKTDAGTGLDEMSATATVSGLQPGTGYHYRLVGTSSAGVGYGSSQTFKTLYADVVFVHPTDNSCSGNSPCCSTIQAAIDTADTGCEIRIAGGTYSESFELNAPKQLTLSGGWNDALTEQNGAVTIIKAPRAAQGSLTLRNVNISL